MKRETRKLLRELVRLVEQDVTELRDAVAEIDEREAEHYRISDARISAQARVMTDHLSMHVARLESEAEA